MYFKLMIMMTKMTMMIQANLKSFCISAKAIDSVVVAVVVAVAVADFEAFIHDSQANHLIQRQIHPQAQHKGQDCVTLAGRQSSTLEQHRRLQSSRRCWGARRTC